MPFKGDRRLGGPHDNEAHLNGTSSDFDSVPAYGTVISGPTDTSRYVNDYLGTPFYMPYSTTVYANGTGGTYSVETWGLQYLPAGWVTSQTVVQLEVSWPTTQLGGYLYGYADGGDPRTVDGNTVNVGYETFNNIEDGTGINYSASASQTFTYANGDTLASGQYGTGADRWRVTFNQFGITANFTDYTAYAVYGTITGYESGDITYSAPCQTFNIGTYSGPMLANGYGNSFSGGTSNTFNGASYLGACADTVGNWNAWYYHDGNGNVTTGNAPAGFQLSSSTSESSFAWSAPDGSSGTYTYQTCTTTNTADGTGQSYEQTNCSGASSGDVIASGSYVTGQSTDENGNSYDVYSNYSLTYNGAGGYNTST